MGDSFVNRTFHKSETPSVPPGLLTVNQSVSQSVSQIFGHFHVKDKMYYFICS